MCCCCNGKFQKPEIGDKWYEKMATIISVILFILAIPELIAYLIFADVFLNGTTNTCCGIISEKSKSEIPGAVCYETDFPDLAPKIPTIDINGAIYCTVNDVVCDEFYLTGDGELTIEQCLNSGGFDIMDMCSSQVFDTDGLQDSAPAFSCVAVFIFAFITTSLCFCDFFGCFKDSKSCQNKCYQLFNKFLELLAWAFFLCISIVFVENPAENGYLNTVLSDDNAAYVYFEENCGELSVIWSELTLDIPEWLMSDGYNSIGYIGLGLSILDFILFFVIICCCKDDGKDIKTATETQIQQHTTSGNVQMNTIHTVQVQQVPQTQQRVIYVNQYGQPIQIQPHVAVIAK